LRPETLPHRNKIGFIEKYFLRKESHLNKETFEAKKITSQTFCVGVLSILNEPTRPIHFAFPSWHYVNAYIGNRTFPIYFQNFVTVFLVGAKLLGAIFAFHDISHSQLAFSNFRLV
jgi:hypothetical protein